MSAAPAEQSEKYIDMLARQDLIISESVFQGETSWVVKDPVGLKYFQLKPPEYFVFQKLNGAVTYTEIRKAIAKEFPELRPTKEDLQNLIVSFHRNGLLLIDATGQASPLRRQRSKEFRQKLVGMLSSLVSIRFPAMDPDRFLSWAYPKIRFCFSKWFTWASLVLMVSALALVLSNFSEFYAKLPKFEQFFGLNNLVYLGFILIFTKSIHELGHGFMCKHFGGECHEIGVMLLVFTPAMYCNTSDSWTLPNKWHRIAIGAGGMYVELFMASIFTFVWWYTHPNWLHFFALNIMFLSSVSTIMFNANPLLRYDGYYILSDFLEIPNLTEKSKISLINKLRVWCLGMEPVSTRVLPDRNQAVFALFSVASLVYRWAVLVLIFWFVTEILEPYGLTIVAHLVIIISVIGMVVVPFVKFVKFFLYPGRMREVKRKHLAITAIMLAIATWFVCFFPLNHNVWGSFVLLPNDAQHVFVQLPSKIIEIRVAPGDRVKKGDVIAVLDNSDIVTAVQQLEAELASLEAEFDVYRLARDTVPNADKLIGQINSEIVKTKRQIEIRKTQQQQLVLRADRDGVIIPPPNIVASATPDNQLGMFRGSPFDLENRGAFLLPQTLFCYVGDSSDLKAVVAIEQRNAKLVKAEQQATLLFKQFRDQRFNGNVTRVSTKELEKLPREISQTNGGFIAGEPQSDGTEKPLLKMYEAVVELEKLPDGSLPGFFGQTKIRVGTASLGWRGYRYVLSLVNFR